MALLSQQDLKNIVKDFQLDSMQAHSNDTISVDIWVEKVSAC